MAGQAKKDNRVFFDQYGRRKVGWIHRSTPTRYLVWYRMNGKARTVWRRKDRVIFAATGRRGRLNPCPKSLRQNTRSHVVRAARLSKIFHGFDPRKLRAVRVSWPRALTCLGVCSQVNYVSRKHDGKLREYYHRFASGCTLYVAPKKQADGTNLLIIRGRFTIEPEGITG